MPIKRLYEKMWQALNVDYESRIKMFIRDTLGKFEIITKDEFTKKAGFLVDYGGSLNFFGFISGAYGYSPKLLALNLGIVDDYGNIRIVIDQMLIGFDNKIYFALQYLYDEGKKEKVKELYIAFPIENIYDDVAKEIVEEIIHPRILNKYVILSPKNRALT